MFKKIIIFGFLALFAYQAYTKWFAERPPTSAIEKLTKIPHKFGFDDHKHRSAVKIGEWIQREFTVATAKYGMSPKSGTYLVSLQEYSFERLDPIEAPKDLETLDGFLYPVQIERSFKFDYNKKDLIYKELADVITKDFHQSFIADMYQGTSGSGQLWQIHRRR